MAFLLQTHFLPEAEEKMYPSSSPSNSPPPAPLCACGISILVNPKHPCFQNFLPRHFSARFVFSSPSVPSLKQSGSQDQTTENAAFHQGRNHPTEHKFFYSRREMLCPRRCCAHSPYAAFRAYWFVFAPAISHPGFWSLGVGIGHQGFKSPPCGVSP